MGLLSRVRHVLKPANDRPLLDKLLSQSAPDPDAYLRDGYMPAGRWYPRDLIQDDNGMGVKMRDEHTRGSFLGHVPRGATANDSERREMDRAIDALLLDLMTPEDRAKLAWGLQDDPRLSILFNRAPKNKLED